MVDNWETLRIIYIMKNQFKCVNRGFDRTIVLLPGWASDYRIFNNLNVSYNYLVPHEYYPQTIQQDLLDELKRRK